MKGSGAYRMSKDLFLVIDMQNVYASGGAWCCPGTEHAAEKIIDILETGKKDMDVVFTRFIASDAPFGVWKDYNSENNAINEDAYANEMMNVFKEWVKKYPLYTKSVYSSLSIPEVRELVHDHDRVVLSGVVAECCVLFTAMALIDAGIPVIYLKDAVAGIDKDSEHAAEKVLSGLAPLHVKIMTTREYLAHH